MSYMVDDILCTCVSNIFAVAVLNHNYGLQTISYWLEIIIYVDSKQRIVRTMYLVQSLHVVIAGGSSRDDHEEWEPTSCSG